MLQYFTATESSAVLTIFAVGLAALLLAFFAEISAVYERAKWALNEELRDNITWRTILWLPVRLFVIILVPQIFYITFTQIISFG